MRAPSSGSCTSPASSPAELGTTATTPSLEAAGVTAGGAGRAGAGSDPWQQQERPTGSPHWGWGAQPHDDRQASPPAHNAAGGDTTPATSIAAARKAPNTFTNRSLVVLTPTRQTVCRPAPARPAVAGT